jgi:hypothetical protein
MSLLALVWCFKIAIWGFLVRTLKLFHLVVLASCIGVLAESSQVTWADDDEGLSYRKAISADAGGIPAPDSISVHDLPDAKAKQEVEPSKGSVAYYRRVRAQRAIAFQACAFNGVDGTEKLCFANHGEKFIGPSVRGDIASEIRFEKMRIAGAKGERFDKYFRCLIDPASPQHFTAQSETSMAAFKQNMQDFEMASRNCILEANEASFGIRSGGDKCGNSCIEELELYSDAPVKVVEVAKDREPAEDSEVNEKMMEPEEHCPENTHLDTLKGDQCLNN